MKLENGSLLSLREAVAFRNRVRRRGGRFVLTNGVFDLLHPGHTSYLAAARRLAGKKGALLVAMNGDRSVRQLKGSGRPVLDQKSRAYNLCQLRSVDAVLVFAGKRLAREIKALKPDVYCKAGDYTVQTLDRTEKEALDAVGARIRFLPFLRGFSTTRLVRQIRKAGSL
jgi:rfaE bifunctional protein nucleotidyltransferase chain/domain